MAWTYLYTSYTYDYYLQVVDDVVVVLTIYKFELV
jgi:hypothetical protein